MSTESVQEGSRRIVSLARAARIVGVSPATFTRMRLRGETPPVVRVSPHRIGLLLCDVYAWIEARKETAA
jgi:predicted DNA-binding transcriptional regulator AlpA